MVNKKEMKYKINQRCTQNRNRWRQSERERETGGAGGGGGGVYIDVQCRNKTKKTLVAPCSDFTVH